MTGEEIKIECTSLYEKIKSSQQRLEEIRKFCPHEKTFNGNWSWRVGCIDPAEICDHCGKMLRYIPYTEQKKEKPNFEAPNGMFEL